MNKVQIISSNEGFQEYGRKCIVKLYRRWILVEAFAWNLTAQVGFWALVRGTKMTCWSYKLMKWNYNLQKDSWTLPNIPASDPFMISSIRRQSSADRTRFDANERSSSSGRMLVISSYRFFVSDSTEFTICPHLWQHWSGGLNPSKKLYHQRPQGHSYSDLKYYPYYWLGLLVLNKLHLCKWLMWTT